MLKFDHFSATPILREIKFWQIKRVQMLFLPILEVLNLDFSKFEQLSRPTFTQIQSSEPQKLPKMTFLDRLDSPKFDITYYLSDRKIIIVKS